VQGQFLQAAGLVDQPEQGRAGLVRQAVLGQVQLDHRHLLDLLAAQLQHLASDPAAAHVQAQQPRQSEQQVC
jgi:hypothetical protein